MSCTLLFQKRNDEYCGKPLGYYLADTVSFSCLKRGWHICKAAEVLGKLRVNNACSPEVHLLNSCQPLSYSGSKR